MARRPLNLVFQDNALLDQARAPAMLDAMKRAGGRRIQQDVVWGDVFRNGAFDWSKLDAEVNAARARGMGVDFRLYGTPAYQSQSQPGADTRLSASHPDPKLAGWFAGETAKHFAGRVGHYGVWNEPNIQSFIDSEPRRAAQQYRSLYQAMEGAIHHANPNAKVGLGEVTSMRPSTRGTQSAIGFLDAVAAGPHALRADYVGVHPYQWSDPKKEFGNPQFGGISNIDAVAKEVRRLGLAGKLRTHAGGRPGTAITEFGYKHNVQRDPKVRARWMREALREAQAAGISDVNLYQYAPGRAGASWDSSIANAQGRIDPSMGAVLRDARTGRL
jgi:hypothetical protein